MYLTHNIGSASALPIIGSAKGAVGERERERERNTETDGSDVTIVAVKLAMSLHVFCQHTYTFVAKNVALFETVRILRKIRTVKWRDGGSKQQNKQTNFRLHHPSSHRKNESNLYQKLLEIEKKIVREVALGG